MKRISVHVENGAEVLKYWWHISSKDDETLEELADHFQGMLQIPGPRPQLWLQDGQLLPLESVQVLRENDVLRVIPVSEHHSKVTVNPSARSSCINEITDTVMDVEQEWVKKKKSKRKKKENSISETHLDDLETGGYKRKKKRVRRESHENSGDDDLSLGTDTSVRREKKKDKRMPKPADESVTCERESPVPIEQNKSNTKLFPRRTLCVKSSTSSNDIREVPGPESYDKGISAEKRNTFHDNDPENVNDWGGRAVGKIEKGKYNTKISTCHYENGTEQSEGKITFNQKIKMDQHKINKEMTKDKSIKIEGKVSDGDSSTSKNFSVVDLETEMPKKRKKYKDKTNVVDVDTQDNTDHKPIRLVKSIGYSELEMSTVEGIAREILDPECQNVQSLSNSVMTEMRDVHNADITKNQTEDDLEDSDHFITQSFVNESKSEDSFKNTVDHKQKQNLVIVEIGSKLEDGSKKPVLVDHKRRRKRIRKRKHKNKNMLPPPAAQVPLIQKEPYKDTSLNSTNMEGTHIRFNDQNDDGPKAQDNAKDEVSTTPTRMWRSNRHSKVDTVSSILAYISGKEAVHSNSKSSDENQNVIGSTPIASDDTHVNGHSRSGWANGLQSLRDNEDNRAREFHKRVTRTPSESCITPMKASHDSPACDSASVSSPVNAFGNLLALKVSSTPPVFYRTLKAQTIDGFAKEKVMSDKTARDQINDSIHVQTNMQMNDVLQVSDKSVEKTDVIRLASDPLKSQLIEISDLPKLTQLPKVGECFFFKELELNEEYSPQISEYKLATVVCCSTDTQLLTLEVCGNASQNRKTGKFELADGIEQGCGNENETRVIPFSSLIEPRLLTKDT